MCKHGDHVVLRVAMPARLSHTGKFRWCKKPVDACLASLIAQLNAAGILTANSCCGHGKGPGGIFLHTGRELTIGQAQLLVGGANA